MGELSGFEVTSIEVSRVTLAPTPIAGYLTAVPTMAISSHLRRITTLVAALAATLVAPGHSQQAATDEVNFHSRPQGGENLDPAAGPEPLPPRPENHVLDRARIFKPDQAEALGDRLARLEKNHGITILVAAYTFLTRESIEDHAVRLKDAWVSDDHGVVVVYLRSTSQITFAASDNFKNLLTTTDLMDIFTVAAGTARGRGGQERDHHEYVIIACDLVAQGLVERVGGALKTQAVYDREISNFTIGFTIFVGALLIAAYPLFRYYKSVETHHDGFYYFPKVEVAERFGARHGGGSIAELNFRD